MSPLNGVDAMAVKKRGFSRGKGKSPAQIKTSVIDETSKQTVRNLFSVCSHIQNPTLYQPVWADACQLKTLGDGRKIIVATKDVKKDQPLTLFPIHALGLRWLNRKNSGVRSKKENNKSMNKDGDDVEFVAYDSDRDPDFMNVQSGLRVRLNIPLDKDQPAYKPALAGRDDRVLFAMLDTSKDATPGWMGGKILSTQAAAGRSNCFTLPLPGVAPLCGIIATRDIQAGEEVVKTISSPSVDDINECREALTRQYGQELTELKQYITMACTPQSREASEVPSSSNIGPFHEINEQYPGLRKLHDNPDIYVVDDFLSADECNRLIEKAKPNLRPCLITDEDTGTVKQDPSRTSSDANVLQVEAPSIVKKLTELLLSDAEHLELLQVLNYKEGQQFKAHTDGFDGPTSACGFEQSNRIATVFTYLNDVSEGGSTSFPKIGLDIKPKRGMAVVHFPSDLELGEDDRTLHEGSIAVDEKWLLATWLWSKSRTDNRYSEEHMSRLSSDTI
jgi:prolyl 4-hydroxylase